MKRWKFNVCCVALIYLFLFGLALSVAGKERPNAAYLVLGICVMASSAILATWFLIHLVTRRNP